MTASAFAFLFAGVVLNAGAQLLLKAGTNTLGVITLTRDNWWGMLWKMGTQGFFIAGIVFVLLGMLLGIWMGMNEDFTYKDVHAHLNLVGWVTDSIHEILDHGLLIRRIAQHEGG